MGLDSPTDGHKSPAILRILSPFYERLRVLDKARHSLSVLVLEGVKSVAGNVTTDRCYDHPVGNRYEGMDIGWEWLGTCSACVSLGTCPTLDKVFRWMTALWDKGYGLFIAEDMYNGI